MAKKAKPQGTSVGGFDHLDSPHQKPIKRATKHTPATRAKQPTAHKKPKSAKRPR